MQLSEELRASDWADIVDMEYYAKKAEAIEEALRALVRYHKAYVAMYELGWADDWSAREIELTNSKAALDEFPEVRAMLEDE